MDDPININVPAMPTGKARQEILVHATEIAKELRRDTSLGHLRFVLFLQQIEQSHVWDIEAVTFSAYLSRNNICDPRYYADRAAAVNALGVATVVKVGADAARIAMRLTEKVARDECVRELVDTAEREGVPPSERHARTVMTRIAAKYGLNVASKRTCRRTDERDWEVKESGYKQAAREQRHEQSVLRKEIERLRRENAQLGAECEKLKKLLAKAQAEVERLRGENADLKRERNNGASTRRVARSRKANTKHGVGEQSAQEVR